MQIIPPVTLGKQNPLITTESSRILRDSSNSSPQSLPSPPRYGQRAVALQTRANNHDSSLRPELEIALENTGTGNSNTNREPGRVQSSQVTAEQSSNVSRRIIDIDPEMKRLKIEKLKVLCCMYWILLDLQVLFLRY